MGNQRAPRTAATHAMRVQQLVNVLRDTPGYTRGEWQTDAKLSRAQSYTDWVRRAAEYDAEEDRLWRQSLMPPALAPLRTHLPATVYTGVTSQVPRGSHASYHLQQGEHR